MTQSWRQDHDRIYRNGFIFIVWHKKALQVLHELLLNLSRARSMKFLQTSLDAFFRMWNTEIHRSDLNLLQLIDIVFLYHRFAFLYITFGVERY